MTRAEQGLRRLALGGECYPSQLAIAPDPPQHLYCQGDIQLLKRTSVAIVGARKTTELGVAMGEQLGAQLAAVGVVVVSGCAIGVDAAAHRGALEVGGDTVAVLGGGLDVSAPASNRALAADIATRGCLVSEHPAGVAPLKHHFPRRNRIIAGLVRIVVVVEAADRSGALITARLALEAGREVMAVPAHPLLPTSVGANRLLADGARAVFEPQDVLDELAALPLMPGVEPFVPIATPSRPAAEKATAPSLLDALSERPATPEELAASVGLALPNVLADLTQLEILGLARALPGSRFTRSHPAAREG
jgi:DNA processing protein